MTFWRRLTGLAAVLGTACLNDPAAPAAYRLEVRPDTIKFLALGDTIRPRVFTYQHGQYAPAKFVQFRTSDTSIAVVDPSGLITSHRVGLVQLIAETPFGASGRSVVSVTQSVALVSVARDTVRLEALNATAPIQAEARDPLGTTVAEAQFRYATTDTAVASVNASGVVRARNNGLTRVWAIAGAESSSTVVRVTQRATQVELASDTVRIDALGVDRALSATALDSLGSPLMVSGAIVALSDTMVVRLTDSTTVRSVGNGTAIATISIAGQLAQALIVVAQVGQSLNVQAPSGITSISLDSLLPITCEAVDSNGVAMDSVPAVQPSKNGLWTGTACDGLRARRSGVDTLEVSLGALQARVPVAIALRPSVGAVEDVIVQGDTSWKGDEWAPSADTAPDGTVELYFGNYVFDSSYGANRSNLVRLLSPDGLNFHYDTLMLPYGPDVNGADGRGIENTVVFPSADGTGWKMLYSGGNQTSGWSVYGASSSDRRNWVKTGPVIGNGYPGTVRPIGEGLLIDRLSDGTWRLIVAAYEPLPSQINTFAITEWHSTDQTVWTYVRTLVSPLEVPLYGIRVTYSPVIQKIGASLWRMIFTADNLSEDAGGASALWSAVSIDFQHWQIEGVLLNSPDANLLYSALARNHLYFLRQGPDHVTHLATVALEMP